MTSIMDILQAEAPYSGIAKIHTVFDAMQAMRETCASFGYKHFSVISVPPPMMDLDESLSRRAILLSWPRELIAEFDRYGLFKDNNVLDHIRGRFAPVVTDLASIQTSPPKARAADVIKLFKQFGVTTGIHFPVMDRKSGLLLVSFLGERGPLTGQEVATLALYSTLIVERISVVTSRRQAGTTSLSPREVEVLQWIAEGKTSLDIAKITGLSEHTVNHYAALATQKLGCVNRTQAVVYAIRMGLFS